MVRAFAVASLRQIAQSRSVRMRDVGRHNFNRLRLRRRQLARFRLQAMEAAQLEIADEGKKK